MSNGVGGLLIRMGRSIIQIGKVGTVLAAWAGLLGFLLSIGIREWIFPFQPTGSFGSPTFMSVKEDTGEYLTIGLPVSLSNNGEGSGCIVDLALKLKATKSKTEWTYYRVRILKPRMYVSKQPGHPEWDIKGPYTRINLQGNQSVIKLLLFLHRPATKLQRLSVSDLTPKEPYKLELYALIGDVKCGTPDKGDYLLLASDEVTFTEFLLEALKTGEPCEVLPFKLDDIREKFITSP